LKYYSYIFDTKFENEKAFPFLFLFNLRSDIIPRFEIIKKYDRLYDIKKAFEMKPEEFLKDIGANMDVINSDKIRIGNIILAMVTHCMKGIFTTNMTKLKMFK
jgi:hypothetical protein